MPIKKLHFEYLFGLSILKSRSSAPSRHLPTQGLIDKTLDQKHTSENHPKKKKKLSFKTNRKPKKAKIQAKQHTNPFENS